MIAGFVWIGLYVDNILDVQRKVIEKDYEKTLEKIKKYARKRYNRWEIYAQRKVTRGPQNRELDRLFNKKFKLGQYSQEQINKVNQNAKDRRQRKRNS